MTEENSNESRFSYDAYRSPYGSQENAYRPPAGQPTMQRESYSPRPPRQTPPPKPPKTFMHHLGQGCLIMFILMMVVIAVGLHSCAKIVKEFSDSDLFEPQNTSKIKEKLLVDSKRDEVIAVINIKGVIGESSDYSMVSPTRIIPVLKSLQENQDVKALILDMDSPGGEVTASDEIHAALLAFKEKKKIPVITCMHSMGASGGYYIAAASDYIIANRNTFTGSIGVIISSLNVTQLLDKIGVSAETYRSGDMKDMLSPTRPRTQKEIEYLNQLIQESYTSFTEIVAKGRPKFFKSGNDVRQAPFADGRVLSGLAAKEMGLVDELGNFDNAVAKALELTKLSGAKVVRYYDDPGWLGLLYSNARQLHPKASDLLPLRSATLEAGRLYYIAPEAIGK